MRLKPEELEVYSPNTLTHNLLNKKSATGTTLPAWLTSPGPVLLRKHARSNKYSPLVERVHLLYANPQYAYVVLPDGREDTVSVRDLAPAGAADHYPEHSTGQTPPVSLHKRESDYRMDLNHNTRLQCGHLEKLLMSALARGEPHHAKPLEGQQTDVFLDQGTSYEFWGDEGRSELDDFLQDIRNGFMGVLEVASKAFASYG